MRHLFMVMCAVAAMSAMAMTTPVEQLPTASTVGTKTYDSTSGVCRTIRYTTSAGDIQLLVCDKGAQYELYRQSAPSGLPFKSCVGGGTVDQVSGFSSFTSTALSSACGTSTTTTPSSLVSPSSTGFEGKTRAENHARLLNIWWDPAKPLVQHFPCTYGTCAWVPWYASGTSCLLGDLQPLDKCGGSGTKSMQNNCMVTDEFSQVMLATAQGTAENEQRMLELYNTVRLIASGSTKYETLPVWVARQTNGAISVAAANRDSASDADARIILALYIAANSPSFSSTARTTFRNYANAMAADFLEHDFRVDPKPGRNGVTINYWLATGGEAANSGFGSNNFSFAGYYGDVVIALLAAYKSTGIAAYATAARDTVEAYLLASEFYGSFRVPPKAFKWDTAFVPQKRVCTDTCNDAWDYYDAPRATTICKARYYAPLAGVPLPADLANYCTAWIGSGGVHPFEYKPQYTWAGAPYNSNFYDGPYENGLALALNFADNTGDLTTRLARVESKWDAANDRFYGQQCLGVYGNAFYLVNLGSAIGRDLPAFGGQ